MKDLRSGGERTSAASFKYLVLMSFTLASSPVALSAEITSALIVICHYLLNLGHPNALNNSYYKYL